MSKILIYADPHYTEQSSIVRSRGEKYSRRIENVISTINWIEYIAEINDCIEVICLGDFFDKNSLTAEEATALQEIHFDKYKTYTFICGNHEMGNNNSSISLANVFRLSNCNVVSEPFVSSKYENMTLCMLPYILETERKSLEEYLNDLITDVDRCNKKVILSHNDIKGINMGAFVTNTGFDVDEIEANANLFINGHVHNQAWLNDKKTILNLGNITGQNFSEDATKYSHQVAILDTKDLSLEFIDNPHAFNFYKLDYSDLSISDIEYNLSKLKNNAVISIKVNEDLVTETKHILDNVAIEYRIIASRNKDKTEIIKTVNNNTSDYLNQFSKFMIDTVGNTDVLQEELTEVCK